MYYTQIGENITLSLQFASLDKLKSRNQSISLYIEKWLMWSISFIKLQFIHANFLAIYLNVILREILSFSFYFIKPLLRICWDMCTSNWKICYVKTKNVHKYTIWMYRGAAPVFGIHLHIMIKRFDAVPVLLLYNVLSQSHLSCVVVLVYCYIV